MKNNFEEYLLKKYPLEHLEKEFAKIEKLGYEVYPSQTGCQIYLGTKMIIDADFYNSYHLNAAHAIDGFFKNK